MKTDLEIECDKFNFIISKLLDGSEQGQKMAQKINQDTKITDMPVLGETLLKIVLSLHKRKSSRTIST